MFLNGFVQTGNTRFCEDSLASEVTEAFKGNAEELEPVAQYRYPSMSIKHGDFKLRVKEGDYIHNQIIVILGENGTGKTTFIQMLDRSLKSHIAGGSCGKTPKISFISHMMEPLQIKDMMNFRVMDLFALCLCLGKPADVYLIDEPSAFMYAEQIIIASKVIKRFIRHTKKIAFVEDHDIMLATYLADRVIVCQGRPSLLIGMNLFFRVGKTLHNSW